MWWYSWLVVALGRFRPVLVCGLGCVLLCFRRWLVVVGLVAVASWLVVVVGLFVLWGGVGGVVLVGGRWC